MTLELFKLQAENEDQSGRMNISDSLYMLDGLMTLQSFYDILFEN